MATETIYNTHILTEFGKRLLNSKFPQNHFCGMSQGKWCPHSLVLMEGVLKRAWIITNKIRVIRLKREQIRLSAKRKVTVLNS